VINLRETKVAKLLKKSLYFHQIAKLTRKQVHSQELLKWNRTQNLNFKHSAAKARAAKGFLIRGKEINGQRSRAYMNIYLGHSVS